MKAVEICVNTKQILGGQSVTYGVVHSVFQQVCNIETKEGAFIPLISHRMPPMPMAISFCIPSPLTMVSLGLEKGQRIIIQNWVLEMKESKFRLELEEARVWDGKPRLDFSKIKEEDFLKNIEFLRKILLENGKLQGIAALIADFDKFMEPSVYGREEEGNYPYREFIWPRIQKLLQWIWKEELQEISSAAKQIIGFGPGLTPAADDLLAGMMIAMVYGAVYHGFDHRRVWAINQAMIEGAKNRTTRVSGEMLSFAAVGEASEDIRQLMVSIYSKTNATGLIKEIFSVLGHGETSGSDLLAGIYMGCKLSLWKNKERVVEKCARV
ncbi:DUF2877 domain-containing protein [Thermotalea metallivorans]|uniref:DUF2877 domain-containing protein n=1 Tax=Thermotalea metallivorans TaxID=520762 RepID=A0A140L136_9FIRM|nr:DUF2877 domain-containing protein [Thermotalea metallivorans]KXG74261.1 hypothetical protein AN619_24530 [Thermotalea metallivorans]